jgi:hypothetical protein
MGMELKVMREKLIKNVSFIGVILLMTVLLMTIYIVSSTRNIDESKYRKYAWDHAKHNESIIDWETATVELVKLPSNDHIQIPRKSGHINRALLKLNGNRAVRVTFKTEFDILRGPYIIYINPNTKEVIGYQAR